MRLCSDRYHPQVPITVCDVMLVYCHQCQAWNVYAYRHTQYDDDQVDQEWAVENYLGPFDGFETALKLGRQHLSDMLRGDGLPWDRSGW